MFFLGGMTMGYLQPPEKAADVPLKTYIPAEKDRRLIEPAEGAAAIERPMERSLIWAWRILC